MASASSAWGIARFFHALENLPADAFARLFRCVTGNAKALLGVKCGALRCQAEAALWNLPDAAPLAINHFEDAIDQLLRRKIAIAV